MCQTRGCGGYQELRVFFRRHVDNGGDIYGYPICGHCQWGAGDRMLTHPEGVIGKATLADPKKAYKTIETFLDYSG